MDLLLNDVLHLMGDEIVNSKIEFNMQVATGGKPFLDRWLKYTEEEKATETCKDCSLLEMVRKTKKRVPRQVTNKVLRMLENKGILEIST